jgi:hypothetical protein
VIDVDSNIKSTCTSDVEQISREERDDSLKPCFKLAQRGKGGYSVCIDLLYRYEKLYGQSEGRKCSSYQRPGDQVY